MNAHLLPPVSPPHPHFGSIRLKISSYEALVLTRQLLSDAEILPQESAVTTKTFSNRKDGRSYGFFAEAPVSDSLCVLGLSTPMLHPQSVLALICRVNSLPVRSSQAPTTICERRDSSPPMPSRKALPPRGRSTFPRDRKREKEQYPSQRFVRSVGQRDHTFIPVLLLPTLWIVH